MTRAKSPSRTLHTVLHKDGSVWAKGYMRGEVMDGSWQWLRKDGTRMRSGSFDNGVQIGKWVTYDQEGQVHKVTLMKNPARAATRPADPARPSGMPKKASRARVLKRQSRTQAK